MARIFSWHIKDDSKDCFSYLASGTSGNYSAGYMVLGDKINDDTSLKQIAEVVSGYTETIYKTQFDNMKQAVADCGFTVTWKNYKEYYDVDGSNLVMLTGEGKQGPQGQQGAQGEKGDTGMAGKGRNIMCYCGLDSGITPTRANVRGGKFYPNQWLIDYPIDPQGICEWQDSNEFGPGKVVWMTNADFPSSTGDSPSEAVDPIAKIDIHGQTYTWATPIQISGPKGDNGADGENIEFVYKRETDRSIVPDRPTGTTEEQARAQGWTDHPEGISKEYKVEYMCQHIKDEDGNWGEFTDPILWASWGEDGNDGDGLEYIFAITKEYSRNEIAAILPSSEDPELADHWQDPEIWDYIEANPALKAKYSKQTPSFTGWTDDPSDVSQEEPYEWVSIRKRKWNEAQDDGVFGEFCQPVLWAHWGKNGEKGDDGKSIDIKGTEDTLGHLLKKLSPEVPEISDSYVIGEEGAKHVYIWIEQDSSYHVRRTEYTPPMEPEWYDKSDSEIYSGYYYQKDNKNYWFTDCGTFAGQDGKNAYVHIKYATDWTGQTGAHKTTIVVFPDGPKEVDLCFTSNNGETPGKYFATYTDDIHDDSGDLDFYDGKWIKFEGEDGQSYGQEQIFFRSASLLDTRSYSKEATASEHGYDEGEWYLNVDYTGSFVKVDWVPTNWTDVPMGIINGIYNFEYVSVRRLLDDGTWSYFSEPALYNEAGDTTDFQVEYSTWTGETTPVLANASEYTDENGNFDEIGWRAAHASTGPWTDSNTNATIWMATAQKIKKNSNSATTIWNDWQITRCKGINGKAGNGRNVMCYCGLDSGITPTRANVRGGKFYPNKWDITYPTDPTGVCEWQDSNEFESEKVVWMTNADFPSSVTDDPNEAVDPIEKTDTHGQTYTWATPIQISGPKGDNGADGNAIEFIYFRTKGEKPDTPTEISQEPDFLPEVYINGVDQGVKWNDHPEGIDEEWRYEWMSQRIKDEHGIWGSFSSVAQWSRWGEDGIDGDGVEYIFATAATLDAGPTLFTKLPKQESFTEEVWQTPEIWDYIKEHHMESTYAPWTDDPSDVSPDEPYEFVSIRRRKYDDTEGNAIFGPFEEPALWARWADDGDSIFTSFSFATLDAGTDISDCIVSGFTTGTTANPSINPIWTKRGGTVVTGVEWKDVPEQQNSSQVIWMVSGVFKKHHNAKTGVDTYTQEQPWSEIQQMVDTADFEVIYCPDENPLDQPSSIPNFKKVGVDIDPNWLAAASQIHWYDEVTDIPSSLGGVIWMATIKGHNNIWDQKGGKDDWQVMKVKGEPGQSPTDLDFLKRVFNEAEVDQKPGAILREFLGVTDTPQGTHVVAFMNGSANVAQKDGNTLMIAAGCNGLTDANNAKFRVYSNGDVFAENGYFKGEIDANSGNIGGIEIGPNGIFSQDEDGYGFRFENDGDIDINNRNLQINNDGIVFKNNAGDNVLSVVNKAYHSLDEFVSTMTGGTASLAGSREYIAIDEPYVHTQTVNISVYNPGATIIDNTTFTVPEGCTNKVTIFVESLVIGAIVYGTGAFGAGQLNYYVDIVLANQNNESVGSFFIESNTINTPTHTFWVSGRSKSFTLGPGTYHMQLQNFAASGYANFSGEIPPGGYQWKLVLDFNVGPNLNIIESVPALSGVEIFRNGIAIKNSSRNYLFAAAPDDGQPGQLIFALMSGGRGTVFSNGSWNPIS